MEFANRHFSKSLTQLTYSDIELYFNEEKFESDRIEYKSYSNQGTFDKQLENIFTAVCAFLNSQGGILIWGAPKGLFVNGRKEKQFQGVLSPLDHLLEKDTLINKISDRINPLPNGIAVTVLENGNSEFIYVFEIQQSTTAHQFNNSYYMRLDGQNRLAPHHYVEARLKQITYPTIEGYLNFAQIQIDDQNPSLYRDEEYRDKRKIKYLLYLEIIIFNFSPLQNEENVAFQLSCDAGIFEEYKGSNMFPKIASKYKQQGHLLTVEFTDKILHYGNPFREAYTLEFTIPQLESNNWQTQLKLTFGGKASPMKLSEYTLSFEKFETERTSNGTIGETGKLNSLIIAMAENILLADKSISRTEQLYQLLGR